MFTINVDYSIKDSDRVESPSLNCIFMQFNSFEDAVAVLEEEIREVYIKSKSYLGFEMQLPENKNEYLNTGYFQCAYIFGPKVRYRITIKKLCL